MNEPFQLFSDLQPDWFRDALCRQHPEPHLWTSDDRLELNKAQGLCDDCPVKVSCALYARDLGPGNRYGVYAGKFYSLPAPKLKRKRCSSCGRERVITQFHKHSQTEDGLRRQCKYCVRQGRSVA